ncbi:hypothetical protein AOXY_G28430 [Acipenser oxyrinchus oxyrinchus]|uniref:Uncharacterized protein n=1 Tax=Acipenser oxyrinchus oxyrinchus TaxID=40147 RepID=A0AAD8CMU0_ACIOX|nr:hypothetical protein AOXY_G28430 [Acipenser oxyrinchus oxyrinchus]
MTALSPLISIEIDKRRLLLNYCTISDYWKNRDKEKKKVLETWRTQSPWLASESEVNFKSNMTSCDIPETARHVAQGNKQNL